MCIARRGDGRSADRTSGVLDHPRGRVLSARPGRSLRIPAAYRGGLFLTAHGSWHITAAGGFAAPPRVAYVAMNGDIPVTLVDWSDPTKPWTEFVGGFQLADGRTRLGRPAGIAVGPKGSPFMADDQDGTIYRIRSP